MEDFNINEVKTLEELYSLLEKQNIDYSKDKIEKAFEFAKNIHGEEKRLSGNSVLTHCLTVASYIAQLKLDTTAVVAALLHDTVEKGSAKIDDVDEEFGTDVAFIVEGLSDLRRITKKINNQKNEEFTNLIFNSSEDIRIILIRLCEKLHNLNTSDNLEKEKKENAAKKVLHVYSPLAEFLGLGVIERLLEDKAFEILYKDEYKLITNSINEYLKEQDNTIQHFEEEINDLMEEYSIQHYELESRKKGIYSAYKKLKSKYLDQGLSLEKALERLMDIYAARIIVRDVEQCYIVLGLIQENFKLLSDEFKDYIARPKPNGYRSIHVLFDFEDTTLEVQIRTKDMHEFAEFGPASHIAYKLQGSRENKDVYTWTKDLIGWKKDGEITKEDFKVTAFKNSVFVFTPKGLVISLPKGATPIDFAFRIHTDVGHKYQGALVNNKMVNMSCELKTGDVVEILTTSKDNVTNDWLEYAKSTTTRYRIKKKLRELNRKV